MNDYKELIKELKGVFTKAQQSKIKVVYNPNRDQLELHLQGKLERDFDNENSVVFDKFRNFIWENDLEYNFGGIGYVEIYRD